MKASPKFSAKPASPLSQRVTRAFVYQNSPQFARLGGAPLRYGDMAVSYQVPIATVASDGGWVTVLAGRHV
ncbi:unnamed protein product, partial [Iphiclides podalirius]